MRSRFWWLLPWVWATVDGGCADPNSCMRNTDCEAKARCVDGVCTVVSATAGSAGTDGSGGSVAGGTAVGGTSHGGTTSGSSGATAGGGSAGTAGRSATTSTG